MFAAANETVLGLGEVFLAVKILFSLSPGKLLLTVLASEGEIGHFWIMDE
jgi:hypothetical protein